MKILIIAALMVFCSSCSSRIEKNFPTPFVAIMANLNMYDGKTIETITYVSFECEGNSAYLFKEDIYWSNTYNGLWLNLPDGYISKFKHGKGVAKIRGKIDVSKHGHLGGWPGVIDVSEITEQYELDE